MIRRLDREGNGLPAPPVWSKLRRRLLEAPAEEQCGANYIENLAKPAAWAETQRSLGTLDRPIITRLLPASSTQRAHDQV